MVRDKPGAAEQGYDVAVTYSHNREGAEYTREQVEKLGRRCLVYPADLQDNCVAEGRVRQARNDLWQLNLLINNAGRGKRNSIFTATMEDLQYIVDTNFIDYLMAAGEAACIMVRDGTAGSVLFVTSTRGESAHPDDFIYGRI